jgi:hypothetical protein
LKSLGGGPRGGSNAFTVDSIGFGDYKLGS